MPAKAWQFVKTPKKSLPFFGLLIVFVTFIVKDALRERSKDRVDGINAAIAKYEIHQETVATHDEVVKLEDEVRQEQQAQKTAPLSNDFYPKIRAILDNGRPLVEKELTSLDLLTPIAKQLPEGDSLSAKVEAIHKELDLLDAYATFHDPSPFVPSDSTAETLKEAQTWENNVRQGVIKAEVLKTDITSKVEPTAKCYEGNYIIVTWASYFLYALGWGLNLAGHFLGIKGIPGAE